MVETQELIKEERGSMKIAEILEDLPKSRQKAKATEIIVQLHTDLQNSLVEQKMIETKLKKLNDKIKMTEPYKAVKVMKGQIKGIKKDTEKMALLLMGMKKMAKALDIELPNVKALLEE